MATKKAQVLESAQLRVTNRNFEILSQGKVVLSDHRGVRAEDFLTRAKNLGYEVSEKHIDARCYITKSLRHIMAEKAASGEVK